MLLAGCASSIKVRDLLSDPGRYNGRTVQVHGVVTKGWPLMNGAYELSDNTGSILVIIDDPRAPRDGTSLKVRGTFRSSYQWDGDNVAAILKSR